MSKKEEQEIRLGRLELAIMNVVWKQGQATVHDVKDVLGKGRKPAYTTILTMMRKLEAKGYLKHQVVDRTYVYQATISQRDVRRSILGDMLERLFDGSPALLVNSLVDETRVDADELAKIRQLIKKQETK